MKTLTIEMHNGWGGTEDNVDVKGRFEIANLIATPNALHLTVMC